MNTHTRGPITCDQRDWLGRPARDIYLSGNQYQDEDGDLVATGVAIVTCPTTGSKVGTANARLLAAAYTSYDRHFGENAVRAAEEDWIGKAVALLADFAKDDPCSERDPRAGRVLQLLSLTKASKEPSHE